MANFGNLRESSNYVDRSAAPWYDPQKLLTDLMVGMQRVYDPKGKQAQLDNTQRTRDANPLPPMDSKADMASTVKFDKSGNAIIHRPGAVFDEVSPAMDPGIAAAVNELYRRKSR
jgi:hypothetical protein